MKQLFARLKNRHFAIISIVCLILVETAFMLAWGGVFSNSYIRIILIFSFLISLITTIFYFINIINDNPLLGSGVKPGVIATLL